MKDATSMKQNDALKRENEGLKRLINNSDEAVKMSANNLAEIIRLNALLIQEQARVSRQQIVFLNQKNELLAEQRKVDDLESDNRTLKRKCDDLEDDVKRLRRERNEAENDCHDLEDDVKRLRKERNQHKSKCHDMQNEIAGLKKQCQELQKDIAELTVKNMKRECNIVLNESSKKLQSEKDKLDLIKEQVKENTSLTIELDELQSSITNLTEERDYFSSEFSRNKEERIDLQKQLETLHKEKFDLVQSLGEQDDYREKLKISENNYKLLYDEYKKLQSSSKSEDPRSDFVNSTSLSGGCSLASFADEFSYLG